MGQNNKDFTFEFGFDVSGLKAALRGIEEQSETSSKRQERKAQALANRRLKMLTAIERAQRKASFRLGSFGTESATAQLKELNIEFDRLRTKAGKAASAGDFTKTSSSLALVNQQLDFAISKNTKLERKFRAQKFAMDAARDSARNMARSYISAFAVMGAAGAAGNTGIGLESVQASMLAASGTRSQADQDFGFVKDTSLALGRDLITSAQGYQQLAVAAKDAGLSSNQAKEMFLAASEASSAFGLTADDTFGVFRAMTQMISKGTVSSEELKQQMGDRLPIAMSTAARATGVTVKEFTKMLENGEVMANDFLPKFSKELRKAARNGGALDASLNTSRVALQRFGTTVQLSIFDGFNEGLGDGVAWFFNEMSEMVKDAAPTFRVLGRVAGFALEILGTGLRAVMQIFRPFAMVLDAVTKGFKTMYEEFDSGEAKLGTLAYTVGAIGQAFRWLAGMVLLPFGVLEYAMDKIEGMEDGPLKTIAALGTQIGVLLAGWATWKGGAMVAGKGVGTTFAGAFLRAFKVGIAFMIGQVIGDVINAALDEYAPDFARALGDFLGSAWDNLKFFFTGDLEAAQRLNTNNSWTATNKLANWAFDRDTGAKTAQAGASSTQKSISNSIGVVKIDINAAGMTQELLYDEMENRIQSVLVNAMGATE